REELESDHLGGSPRQYLLESNRTGNLCQNRGLHEQQEQYSCREPSHSVDDSSHVYRLLCTPGQFLRGPEVLGGGQAPTLLPQTRAAPARAEKCKPCRRTSSYQQKTHLRNLHYPIFRWIRFRNGIVLAR